MNDELEPLSPELTRLLEAERGEDVIPAAAKAQVLAQVFARTAAPGPVASAPAAWTARVAQVGVVAFVGGAVVGAWLQAQRAPSVPAPRAAPTASGIAEPADEPLEPAAPPPVPAAPPSAALEPPPEAPAHSASSAPPRASSAAASDTGDVAAERRLIEQAQTALARGDGAAALEATAQHAARFPHGELAEEREYVAILALEQMGRPDEAARRGSRFLRAFPSSVFAPRVAGLFDAEP